MTVLDQVLQAETASREAIEAAKEAASKVVADAELVKQTAINDAKEKAAQEAAQARAAAESEVEKDISAILKDTEAQAAAVTEQFANNTDELVTQTVEAFKNA